MYPRLVCIPCMTVPSLESLELCWCDCLLGRCLDEDEVGDGQEADASRSSIVHYACLRALPDRTAPCRKIVWQRATLVILLTKGLPRQLRTSRS